MSKEKPQNQLDGEREKQIRQLMAENMQLKRKLGNRRQGPIRQSSAGQGLSGLAGFGSAPEMPPGYYKKRNYGR